MSAGRARTAIPILVVLAVAAILGWFLALRDRAGPSPEPPASTEASRPVPPPSSGPQASVVPPSSSPDGSRPAPVGVPSPGGPSGPGPVPSGSQTQAQSAPSFDIVRVEPTGESVIAGRAAPGSTVELLRDGAPFATAQADPSGQFAIVPPDLPAGSHEITIRATGPDGAKTLSKQSATVVIAANRGEKPLVAMSEPDRPTTILSQPDAGVPAAVASASPGATRPEPGGVPQATGPAPTSPVPGLPAGSPDLRIASVESGGTGRLYVSGQALPGAAVRLYLNDTFIAPGATGPDGRFSFTIERGVRPGDYRVRLDQVDAGTGAVRSRAEVPFSVPAPATVASAAPDLGGAASRTPAPAPNTAAPESAQHGPAVSRTRDALAPGTAPAGAGSAGTSAAGVALTGRPTEPVPARGVDGAPTRGDGSPSARQAPNPGKGAVVASLGADPGKVVVPEVNTAIVSRGDNLWRISKRTYGEGLRYTVIFGANTPQIRNPDLIYPGQVFVLPSAN